MIFKQSRVTQESELKVLFTPGTNNVLVPSRVCRGRTATIAEAPPAGTGSHRAIRITTHHGIYPRTTVHVIANMTSSSYL